MYLRQASRIAGPVPAGQITSLYASRKASENTYILVATSSSLAWASRRLMMPPVRLLKRL